MEPWIDGLWDALHLVLGRGGEEDSGTSTGQGTVEESDTSAEPRTFKESGSMEPRTSEESVTSTEGTIIEVAISSTDPRTTGETGSMEPRTVEQSDTSAGPRIVDEFGTSTEPKSGTSMAPGAVRQSGSSMKSETSETGTRKQQTTLFSDLESKTIEESGTSMDPNTFSMCGSNTEQKTVPKVGMVNEDVIVGSLQKLGVNKPDLGGVKGQGNFVPQPNEGVGSSLIEVLGCHQTSLSGSDLSLPSVPPPYLQLQMIPVGGVKRGWGGVCRI